MAFALSFNCPKLGCSAAISARLTGWLSAGAGRKKSICCPSRAQRWHGRAVKEIVVVAALLLSFATLLTTHIAIGVRLTWRVRPRYRGLLALLVPPLAPVWAYEQRWRRMGALWVGSVLIYTAALVVALL